MIEELPDDIENDIDDIEPVGEEASCTNTFGWLWIKGRR